MLLVGETGHIVLANGNAERMFGYDPGELQGMPVDTLVPHRVREQHVGRRAAYFAPAAGAGDGRRAPNCSDGASPARNSRSK